MIALAKVVDDFLITGVREAIEQFHNDIAERFKVGRFVLGRDLIFNRLRIQQDEYGSVLLDMSEYLEKIQPLEITRSRRKEFDPSCTPEELTAYLGLAGSLNFLGHGILPQAAFAASYLQQAVGSLKVSDIVNANKVLQEIKCLTPSMKFQAPKTLDDVNPSYLSFSDASHGSTSYGQTGYLSGIYLPAGGEFIYHLLDWLSCKQTRVAFSSIGAEILAAATSTDRGSLMAERLQIVFKSDVPLPFVLTVDSNGLYSTITTLHEGSDYRLRPTVARMRDSYEVGEIALMQWIAGSLKLADALTKRNIEMYKKLNDVMTSGLVDPNMFENAKRFKFTS